MYSTTSYRTPLYRENKPYSSINDYTTLEQYNYSFYNAPKLSDLRMVIAPGSSKHFNESFKVNFSSDSRMATQFKETNFEIVPFKPCEFSTRKENNRYKTDYIGYKK